MNETEKRRKKLLEQTRMIYQDEKINPAVHPRYKAAYYQIYEKGTVGNTGTLGLRSLICILLFFAYITMGAIDTDFLEMDNMQICNKIMYNYNLFKLF